MRAAPGGDVLRDGASVLPTGRNIHSLDPYRLPSAAAAAAGAALADEVLRAHAAAHGGAAPQTVAVPLWGLDAIKTRGEAVGLVLGLAGAAVVRDATGRVVRFELRPLAALGGRPRVDVLVSVSGIFRDTFANTVDLLDDMFRRAAAADEDPALNFIRAHALEAAAADGGGGGGVASPYAPAAIRASRSSPDAAIASTMSLPPINSPPIYSCGMVGHAE